VGGMIANAKGLGRHEPGLPPIGFMLDPRNEGPVTPPS
jgi:hypothetical protein